MTRDEFEHFLEAQDPVYQQVISELAHGEKRSHWMWFIFPQIEGLGHSLMAQKFAIHSLDEARRYAAHAVLGKRLHECTRLVGQVEHGDFTKILGYPDNLKFHSCMTLFTLAAPEENLFASSLAKFFNKEPDSKTLAALGIHSL
jgi:uncharacterized protein (DUF1810 family)